MNLSANCQNVTTNPDTLSKSEIQVLLTILPRIATDLKECDLVRDQNQLYQQKIDVLQAEIGQRKEQYEQAQKALVRERKRRKINGLFRTGLEIVAVAILVYHLK